MGNVAAPYDWTDEGDWPDDSEVVWDLVAEDWRIAAALVVAFVAMILLVVVVF